MKRSHTITGVTIGIALTTAIFASCVTDEGEPVESSEIRMSLDPQPDPWMRANPSERPEQILVAFRGVSLHHLDYGWVDVDATGVIDLLAPRSVPWELLSALVPDGPYDQLRLDIRFSAVEVDGRWYDLEIPSGETSGFKIHTNFCLFEGELTNLNLKWNVADSLHHNEGRGYWLTPSIDVTSPPSCTDDMRAR